MTRSHETEITERFREPARAYAEPYIAKHNENSRTSCDLTEVPRDKINESFPRQLTEIAEPFCLPM